MEEKWATIERMREQGWDNKAYALRMTNKGEKGWVGGSSIDYQEHKPGFVKRVVEELRAALNAS